MSWDVNMRSPLRTFRHNLRRGPASTEFGAWLAYRPTLQILESRLPDWRKRQRAQRVAMGEAASQRLEARIRIERHWGRMRSLAPWFVARQAAAELARWQEEHDR